MAFSLEIRVPFCQARIRDFADSLPMHFKLDPENQKKILFKAAEGIVPTEVLNRKKQPFTLPVLDILKTNKEFKQFIEESIVNNSKIKGYFNVNKILSDINGTINKKQADVIWAILVLGLWMQQNV
jgi:asparagine synthase (glutamine-hydrolysing)